jgi:hypothetical protein
MALDPLGEVVPELVEVEVGEERVGEVVGRQEEWDSVPLGIVSALIAAPEFLIKLVLPAILCPVPNVAQ